MKRSPLGRTLIIVESPAKAKTIERFLGRRYKVQASMGHIRDLPKSQFGVDIEADFEPKYITIRGKGQIVSRLRQEARSSTGCCWPPTPIARARPSPGTLPRLWTAGR